MWTDWPTVDYVASGRRTLPFHDWVAHGVHYRRRANRFSKVPLARWYDRRWLPRIQRIVANSEFTRHNAERSWNRPVESCLLGAPVPTTDHGRPPAERDGVVILTGWTISKNPMGVLGTIREVVHRFGRRDIRFTVTGRGDMEGRDEFIARHGLADCVIDQGYVSEEEKMELLNRARICLYIPLAEPFGLVPVEAMLRRTPVVASNHGGPSEVVLDGVTGRLVDPYDPREVAQAVVDIYDDLPALEAMGSAGAERARALFSFTAFLDRFEAVLHRAVAGG